jgi:hypothetical protein
MTKWEYLSRTTYWTETGRGGDYIQWVQYAHVWKPDFNDSEKAFPSDAGLDFLGAGGWELVAVTPSDVSLVTRTSPQQGDAYSQFTIYNLFFKRPLSE